MPKRALILGAFAVTLLLALFMSGVLGVDPLELDGRASAAPAHEVGADLTSEDDSIGELEGDADSSVAAEEERESLSSRPDAALDDRLTGEVRDHLARPLPGAEIDVRWRATSGSNSLDLAYGDLTYPVGRTTTDAAGAFAIDVPLHRPLELLVRAPRHALEMLDGVFGGEHVVVELGLGATFEGRITSASTGIPQPDVQLRGWMMRPSRKDLIAGRTDAGGNFYFDGLPPGVLRFAVEPDVLASPEWADVPLRAGDVVRRDYELEDGVAISGVVSDSSTGEPIAGAEVGAGWTFDRPVFTDAHGHYVLRGFGGPGVYEVFARAKGYGKAQHEYDYEAMPDADTELDFALPPARAAIGRIVGPDAEPLGDVYVAGVASQREGQVQRTDWSSTRTEADGRFRVPSLTPDLCHQLLVRATGYGTLVLDFPPDEAEQDELDLGTIRLAPAGWIVGRVVDDDGAPRAGIDIMFTGRCSEGRRYLPEGQQLMTLWYTDEVESRTDRNGAFHFTDLAAGSYTIRATEPGNARPASVEVELGPSERRSDLVLPLLRGLAIRGRVVDGNGLPCRRVTLRLTAEASQSVDGKATTDAAGEFELIGLEAGPYTLRASSLWFNLDEERNDDERELCDAELAHVVAGTENLRVVLPDVSPIRGRVLAADGSPATDVVVQASDPATGASVAQDRVGSDGDFRLAVPAGAVVDLETLRIELHDGGGYTTYPATPEDARRGAVYAGTTGIELQLTR